MSVLLADTIAISILMLMLTLILFQLLLLRNSLRGDDLSQPL